MVKRLLLGLAVTVASATGASALTITGTAEVLGSDFFSLDGYRVYLLGVESVEQDQTCSIQGTAWECWAPATRALQQIATEGVFTCEAITDPDPANQVIALCTVHDEDVGGRLIREGWAISIIAETQRYLGDQTEARLDKKGLWQGTFTQPSIWRRAHNIFVDRPLFVPVVPVP